MQNEILTGVNPAICTHDGEEDGHPGAACACVGGTNHTGTHRSQNRRTVNLSFITIPLTIR
jgi:hypothetical protein